MISARSALFVSIALIGLSLTASRPVLAEKKVKIKEYVSETTLTCKNEEALPVYGLVISLSDAAMVVADEKTGFVGPFRNIQGNSTSKVTLTNPEKPFAPGEPDGGIDLTFRSYASKLKVHKWWWVDKKGKPVGEKKEL